MNAHVTYTLARQRSTELQRAGHRARLANEARSTSPDRQLTRAHGLRQEVLAPGY